MGVQASDGLSGRLIARVRRRGMPDPGAPVRMTCVASVEIPEGSVMAALGALTAGVPSLRRYRARTDSVARARGSLVEALRGAGQDAKRSPHDVGVRVLEAAGSTEHIEAVYSALAPYVAAGSYVQAEGRSQYWTFEGGAMVSHAGQHPGAGELARRSSAGELAG